jgi:hypothetical protein
MNTRHRRQGSGGDALYLRQGGPELVEPDWPSVAGEFDAIHLTVAGLATAQGVPVAGERDVSMLWGWDAEATAWLTWQVENVQFLGIATSDRPAWA